MWVHAVAGHTWAAVGSTDVWVTTAAVVVPGQVWSLPDPISRQATSGAMVLAAVQLTESERQAAGITLQADHYAWRITWDSPVTYGYMVLLSGARGMTGNGAYVGVYGTWPLPAAGLAAGATEVVLPMHTRLRVVPRAPGSAVIMGATDVVRAPQVRWSYETLAAGIVAGDLLVLHHQAETAPAVLAQGQTVNLGRTALAGVRVIGADGQVINTGYTADLAGGTLSVSSVVGWSQPVRIQHRIEEVLACAELSAERPDRVRFIRATQRTFPPGAYLSSAISLGDLQARASASWEQEAWTSTWSDARIGNGPAAQYDQLAHPVEVVNRHAVTERWRLDWTSSTTVRVIGEQLGVLGSYSILADVAPLNPATGGPYFTVRAAGFGTGWQAGNQLRINTFGAIAPFWAGLVLLPAAGTGTADSIELCGRGDVPIE
jgi:hypothetical protein